MWIMGANGTELADVKFFKVMKNIGGKDKKWTITGYPQAIELIGGIVCAYFSDEDKAIAALEKVTEFIEENPGKVYRFDKLYK